MARSTDKPRIHLARGILGLPFWVCRMPGKIDGGGSDPQSAYRDWRRHNFSQWGLQRKIDLGRYAGTYGGAHPDQEAAKRPVVDSGRIIAGVLALAIIVAGIISAVMLWDAA